MAPSEIGDDPLGRAYLDAMSVRLERCLDKIKHCLGQIDDEQLWWRPHESQNSIANILLHLCGNLESIRIPALRFFL